MATPVQNAPKLEIGKLTAEDAERFASMFRPIWELDDAPFAAGTKLSASEMDALAAGAGVAKDVQAFGEKTEISAPPAAAAPQANVEVEIDVEPDPTPPPPAAPVVAQAKPQPAAAPAAARAKAPYVPPRAPPVAIRMPAGDSGEYAPVKKSNTGLILGAVGVLLVGGGIFAVKSMMGSKTEAQAPTTTATATHEEARIPPPPPETAAANNDTKPAATTPAATAAPTQEDIKPVPAAMAPAPVETHAAAVSTHTNPPPANTGASAGGAPHPAPTHHAAAGGGAGTRPHGNIVRDNPF